MAISDYDGLVTAVDNWLARTDLSDRTPEFIALTEASLNRTLRVRQMEQRSTAEVDPESDEPEFISLPTDFQVMRRIRLSSVDGKPPLEFIPQAVMDSYRSNTVNVTGQPKYFTISGSEIELAPTPSGEYTLEMVYRKNIPALSESNTTNWLLTLAPDVYLFGALLQASGYMVDEPRIQTWAQGFAAAVDQLNKLSQDSSFNAGPLVVRPSGVVV